jgi:hypothetical protein
MRSRSIILVFLFLLTANIVACSVGTSKPDPTTAQRVVGDLTYIQDLRTGLCFAMVSTSHAGQASDDGLSITWVPCEPKVLELIGK